jgi:hypothetical protein
VVLRRFPSDFEPAFDDFDHHNATDAALRDGWASIRAFYDDDMENVRNARGSSSTNLPAADEIARRTPVRDPDENARYIWVARRTRAHDSDMTAGDNWR